MVSWAEVPGAARYKVYWRRADARDWARRVERAGALVEEAGRDPLAGSIDDPRGLRRIQRGRADPGDAAVADGDIAYGRLGTGAVEIASLADDHVVERLHVAPRLCCFLDNRRGTGA